jgi:hypothetical protein
MFRFSIITKCSEIDKRIFDVNKENYPPIQAENIQ